MTRTKTNNAATVTPARGRRLPAPVAGSTVRLAVACVTVGHVRHVLRDGVGPIAFARTPEALQAYAASRRWVIATARP